MAVGDGGGRLCHLCILERGSSTALGVSSNAKQAPPPTHQTTLPDPPPQGLHISLAPHLDDGSGNGAW